MDIFESESYEDRFETVKKHFLIQNVDIVESKRVDEVLEDFLVCGFGVEDLQNAENQKMLRELISQVPSTKENPAEFENELKILRDRYENFPEIFQDLEETWNLTGGMEGKSFEEMIQTNNQDSRFVASLESLFPSQKKSVSEKSNISLIHNSVSMNFLEKWG